jgi:hypothetical protein
VRTRALGPSLGLGLLLLVGLGVGCNNDCYNLAQSICQCQANPTLIAACQADVSQQNGVQSPTAKDLARCHTMLQTCDCRSLASGSYQSKVLCGLARENPQDSSLNPKP